jgi:two-component system, cell cycle response regulator
MDREKRVIIIDDEKNLLFILKEHLEACGIEAYVYERPPDLAMEIREKRPSAVLLDIMLSDTSGIEILERIRKIDANLPVIMMTGYLDQTKKIESLGRGAYALLEKPFESLEELYHVVNNASNHYIEMARTIELTAEIEKRHEHERLNLLELDFLKSLQLMIGETEDPAFVLKNSFSLLKNFINFNTFAALLPHEDEINIQIYPNIEKDERLVKCVTDSLVKRISHAPDTDKPMTVVMNDTGETIPPQKGDYQSVVVDISARNKVYGYAGLYKDYPFGDNETTIFHRFCSNIALTLEKINLFKEIKALSIHDGLTGIYNHAYVVRALEEEIERSRRYGSHVSIILLDIDDFKKINDSYGHLAGDYVLRTLAETLKDSLRTIDIVGRYGGEEFIAVLPETEGAHGYTVGERFRQQIEGKDFMFGGTHINVTISGGVASYSDGMDVNKAIKVADDNLYRAKREGKNKVCYDQQQ